jgi:hypothetical protein
MLFLQCGGGDVRRELVEPRGDQPRGRDVPRRDLSPRQRRARHHQRDESDEQQRPDPRGRPLVATLATVTPEIEMCFIWNDFRSDRHANWAVPGDVTRVPTAQERRSLVHRTA